MATIQSKERILYDLTSPAVTTATSPSKERILSGPGPTSPVPSTVTTPSAERISSSPDPMSLAPTTSDPTAPPTKRRKISGESTQDAGLYTPQNIQGDPNHTLWNNSGHQLSHVQIPRASLPSVAHIGGHPDKEAVSEDEAFWRFGKLAEVDGSRYVELNDFTIYHPRTSKRSLEMCTLDKLNAGKGVDQLAFSGALSTETTACYVHRIAFCTLAIDGYGDTDCASLSGKICIQSPMAQSKPAWFRLGRPSKEYRRFHEDFVWLATFAKYFADFLLEDMHKRVTLHSFRSEFLPWLVRQYGNTTDFQSWHQQCGFQQDFGTSAAAWVYYLHKECFSINDEHSELLQHLIWSEIGPVLKAIKCQSSDGSDATV